MSQGFARHLLLVLAVLRLPSERSVLTGRHGGRGGAEPKASLGVSECSVLFRQVPSVAR